jgi:hypothetical protein
VRAGGAPESRQCGLAGPAVDLANCFFLAEDEKVFSIRNFLMNFLRDRDLSVVKKRTVERQTGRVMLASVSC